MPPTPFDPVLWLGAALLAGAAGAWLAGAVRAPMAAGALAAGWCAAVLPAPPHDPSLGIRWVIAALLGMLLGAEMASGRSLPRALL
ncbi:MAG TPA: hypothetical protein VJV23_05435, partial [Candidatus Polarisedimenticolia bacterium]|nr:hypothetical protein [Candidatus Polarisedimenticolia bacterium]